MSTEKNPYSSPQDLSLKLGISLEEAEKLWNSWHYQPPEDLDEFRRYANKATRYEYLMRGLNYDFATGEITSEEYHQQEAIIYLDIFGEE